MEYRKLFYIFVIICLIYYLFKLVSSSVFLKRRDKINVVFYGEKVRFYSLDKKNINYSLTFSNLAKVIVPGGYGEYKVGSIGKLANLEKNPNLIRKTISVATSTLVDLYFYQKKPTIYYDNSNLKQTPSFMEIFLTDSNANLIDRIFLLSYFSTNNNDNFQIIDLEPFESNEKNIFDYNYFYKKFQGSFFQRSYRKDNINVQILYLNSYKTAQLIGQMIEGEGIRVVDLSTDNKKISGCLLISNAKTRTTKTYNQLEDFFRCKTQVGETTVSDIIFKLGDLEKDWAVN